MNEKMKDSEKNFGGRTDRTSFTGRSLRCVYYGTYHHEVLSETLCNPKKSKKFYTETQPKKKESSTLLARGCSKMVRKIERHKMIVKIGY